MTDELRRQMVRQQLRNRGITSPRVLEAMERVPRERFVPENLRHLSYEDSPLPLPGDQTISQPFIIALMAELLELSPGDRVLEVGGGSGYAAAVLGQVAGTVYSMERQEEPARKARDVIAELEYENVCMVTGDGTAGLPELAPFDAILISVAGEKIPAALIDQLKPGGRLVSPVGQVARTQSLYRIRKRTDSSLHYEKFGAVQFVPLVVPDDTIAISDKSVSAVETGEKNLTARDKSADSVIKEAAEPLFSIDNFDFGRILERIGDARIVFMGEATHGTSEFYRFRSALSRELILRKNFSIIALEADWPDARVLDSYVHSRVKECSVSNPFSRFPAWMWRNKEMQSFLVWLQSYNRNLQPEAGASVYGLDLFSMYSSIDTIVCHLEKVDPDAGARRHFSCLTRWEDPLACGQHSLSSGYADCESAALKVLTDLLENRFEQEAENYFDTVQNARLVQNAEQYYRAMYRNSAESWNLRDRHMFGTLLQLLEHHGSSSRAIVWAHNSHCGNSAATEMKARGETNLGELGRDYFKDSLYSIGFGTNHGTVAAASYWDGPVEIKKLRPAHPQSYEAMFHFTGRPAFLLPLRNANRDSVVEELLEPRLQRAIGVIYRPRTELSSHYFKSVLPRQFDEYIWFDETTSLHPLSIQVADWPATAGTGYLFSSDGV